MSRIRTIKPEIPQSETLGRCTPLARLLFVWLVTASDCFGNQRGAPALLASTLFPYDDDIDAQTVDNLLGELETQGCVLRYQVSGASYVHLCRWELHQKIHKPTKSTIPPPPAEMLSPEIPPGNSGEFGGPPNSPGVPREILVGPGPGPRVGTHIPGTGNVEPVDNSTGGGLDEETITEGLTHLSEIRAARNGGRL